MSTRLIFPLCLLLINVPLLMSMRVKCSSQALYQPQYHKIAPCAISRLKSIMQSYQLRTEDCTKLAGIYKGLAFNFRNFEEDTGPNCIIYGCPELDEMSSIERVAGFNYYTQFADPMPWVNTTCMPQVGIIELVEARVNYSTAATKCRQRGAYLADVSSQIKNAAFSNHLKGLLLKNQKVFVGLKKNPKTGQFETIKGEPLSCFDFRAWGPGEPHRQSPTNIRDCVALSDKGTWHTVECRKKLPFLCQLVPNGPSRISLTTNNKGKSECDKAIDVFSSEPVSDEFTAAFKQLFSLFIFLQNIFI